MDKELDSENGGSLQQRVAVSLDTHLSQQTQLPILNAAASTAVVRNGNRWRGIRIPSLLSYLPAASFALMFYFSFTAVRQSHGIPPIAFFVASSLSILGFLYLAPRSVADNNNIHRRDRVKIAMWCSVMLAVHLQLNI